MTSIEWTHRPGTKGVTWNPIVAYRWITDPQTGERKRLRGWHCEHASTGCINCYSETQNEAGYRGGTKLPYKPGHRKDIEIELHEPTLLKPLHWKAPRTIFVCSMTDLYGEWVTDEMLDRIKAVEALTPQHTYIELTKRAERMRDYVSQFERRGRYVNSRTRNQVWNYPRDGSKFLLLEENQDWPLPNVWLGVSCERQEEADERIPLLLQTPAAVRFISAEPLLGAIDLENLKFDGGEKIVHGFCGQHAFRDGDSWEHAGEWPGLDWVIVGGESGSSARPFDIAWADELVDQCRAAGVACFVKQLGAQSISDGYPYPLKNKKGGDWNEWPDRLRIREFPKTESTSVIDSSVSQSGLSSPDSKNREAIT